MVNRPMRRRAKLRATHGSCIAPTSELRLLAVRWPPKDGQPGAACRAAASPARTVGATGGVFGGAPRRHRQAVLAACAAPFLRHAFAASRLRHPHGAGTARPQRCAHDADLHACVEPGRARGAQSAGCELIVRNRRGGFALAFSSGTAGEAVRPSPDPLPEGEGNTNEAAQARPHTCMFMMSV